MQKLGRLERVKLREAWSTEAQDFTPWLAREENLAILGETLEVELQPEAQEKNVGPFRADILCRNADDGGTWVLIENQLERTDHLHLGQLLTYAAGLNAVTICWIAASFTDEHRAALDWLNEITDERFHFFGLEVELWRIGNSDPAPKFNLVSKPNDWRRSVIEIVDPDRMSPLRRQQYAFWTQLMKRLETDGSPVRSKKPQTSGWMQFGVGRADFWLEATLNAQQGWISVDLFMRGADAATHFESLREQQESIEEELGEPLDWRELPNRKSSSLRLSLKDVDPTNEDDRPRQIEWMAATLTRFHTTFAPRIRGLAATVQP